MLYKYTRDGSNWKKEQVVEFDFIINENETYEMLFSSMYEWSRVYFLSVMSFLGLRNCHGCGADIVYGKHIGYIYAFDSGSKTDPLSYRCG